MIEFLEPTDLLLRNVQTRIEKHGEEDVPALDLAVSVTGGNRLLDMLHPDLRAALFKPAGPVRDGELDLPVDDRPSARFSGLGMPVKWDREQVGMTLRVAYGATGKADMVMGLVKLAKIRVESVIEGGSVEIRFNLSTSAAVTEKLIGKLSLLQGHTISVTLQCAEVEDTKPSTPQLTVDDVFGAAPAQTPEQALIGTEPAEQGTADVQ